MISIMNRMDKKNKIKANGLLRSILPTLFIRYTPSLSVPTTILVNSTKSICTIKI